MISHYVQIELDFVLCNLVCDYMKKQENPKIQKLVLKLKSLVPSIQITGKTPSIEEVLNHTIVTRKILVPAKKEFVKSTPRSTKETEVINDKSFWY